MFMLLLSGVVALSCTIVAPIPLPFNCKVNCLLAPAPPAWVMLAVLLLLVAPFWNSMLAVWLPEPLCCMFSRLLLLVLVVLPALLDIIAV